MFDNDKIEALDKNQATYNEKLSNIDPIHYVELVSNEFHSLSEIIKDFFLSKKDEIKAIYNHIRNNDFPYNKINCFDIQAAIASYMDYNTGLVDYVLRILDLQESDEISTETLTASLDKVSDKDSMFTHRLFTYGTDESPVENKDLNESMKNIEVLIDMDHNFNTFKMEIIDVVNKYNEIKDNPYKAEIMKKGILFMINSIRTYHYYCIKAIFRCYTSIHKSIQNRTPVSGEKKVPEYQMF